MTTWFGKATIAGAAALMLAGLTATAQGFLGPNPSRSGTGRLIQVKGKIVCTACYLQDVRQAQPNKYQTRLYQVVSEQGQLVIEIESVSNPVWFDYHLVPRIWFRGDAEQLQKLNAPENLTKEVSISAFLTSPYTFDVREVTLQQ